MSDRLETAIATYALSKVPKLGYVLQKRLLQHFGSVQNVWEAKQHDLLEVQGLGTFNAEPLLKEKNHLFQLAKETLQKTKDKGIEHLLWSDEDYPELLRQIPDPPLILFYQGDVASLSKKHSIAVVGSRRCTNYGLQQLDVFLEGIRHLKPLIVSGLAEGIDVAAHRAAFKHGMTTVSVLPSSIDSIYPKKHLAEAKRIAQEGVILTEHAFGHAPVQGDFPIRNRLIAGLTKLVFIPEAAEKSGSLITASLANQYNREVFAVPGDLSRKQSMGCNQLIANQGAHLFHHLDELLAMMRWDSPEKSTQKAQFNWSELSDEEQKIGKLLAEKGNWDVENLVYATGIVFHSLTPILLEMELKGLVKSKPGGRYEWLA